MRGATTAGNEQGRQGRRLVSATVVSAVAAVIVALAAACAPAPAPPVTDPGPGRALLWLHATRGTDPAVYDAAGRRVLLRGVNVNQLGDYFQAAPSLPTVTSLTDADWAAMAGRGMTVVRLVTSWSSWEPTRGTLDAAYLARVRSAVVAAADHGLHVVIDMHQDAWGATVFTPATETCPSGTRPQIGWDGAPGWATFTDGEPTCTPGGREDSPAAVRAWASFHADRDGIRTELAHLWGRIAAAFADEPAVAGYDLLNEPNTGGDAAAATAGLGAFYRDAIVQIRAAERAAGSPGHVVFFEPTIQGQGPEPSFTDDDNIVFAPHNYGESIGPQVEGLMELEASWFRLQAAAYRTTTWIGEWGFFGGYDPSKPVRFAGIEDADPGAGSTWWQWNQACGDPHDVNGAYPPDAAWIAQQATRCGGEPNTEPCAQRAFPRAVPGRLVAVEAPCTGERLVVDGTTPSASTAELWFPGGGATAPHVSGSGVGTTTVERLGDGWLVWVAVGPGDYRVALTAA